MKVVINGCGIAGPALAYWLLKAGHEPLLVEEAATPRAGGYVIDFWGAGYDIAEKMGLLPSIEQFGYNRGYPSDHKQPFHQPQTERPGSRTVFNRRG